MHDYNTIHDNLMWLFIALSGRNVIETLSGLTYRMRNHRITVRIRMIITRFKSLNTQYKTCELTFSIVIVQSCLKYTPPLYYI